MLDLLTYKNINQTIYLFIYKFHKWEHFLMTINIKVSINNLILQTKINKLR